jgi:hypothetical protein
MDLNVESILNKSMELVTSPKVVSALTQEEVTDFERGKIAGKIEMVQHIMQECATIEAAKSIKKNENSDGKRKRGTEDRVSNEQD